MPLLRNLKMRLFDDYVGIDLTSLTSVVRNDYQHQFSLTGVAFPATHVTVNVPAGYVHELEDEDCIVGLAISAETDTVCYTTGHIHWYGTFSSECVFLGTQFECSGYLVDTANDALLMPGDGGEFSISFWLNPYIAPSGTYSILAKKISGFVNHRFMVEYNSTGDSPEIVFSAASKDAITEYSVSAEIVPGRWSLVVARCSGSKLKLEILCADGFVSKEQSGQGDIGCAIAGDTLYLGIFSDAASNRLDSGSFYIQQVCFWDKEITDSEKTELFSFGRGKTRFSDMAVPETFNAFGIAPSNSRYKYGSITPSVTNAWYVDIDSSGKVTKVYENSEPSPYVPCTTCDSPPCCYPNSMMDPSPDEISLSVSWSAASGGCIPEETTFVMTRNPRQIIQGFIFGRTFESEKITLPCGGYIRFFLESTPYHWSKYKYRNYLGVEFNSPLGSGIAKFNVTMGAALVRNSVTGGSNKFTSPGPAPEMTSFDFPYTDSFEDYAEDLIAAGWTEEASVLLYEDFPSDGCATNIADAACLVADGYRFGVGVDYPELRGGYCGWQMGISEFVSGSTVLGSQDSKYNYKITCGSPAVLNGVRVVPSDTLLHRPFSAMARELIGIHDTDGYIDDVEMPFTGFSAVLSASEFVRPQPFTQVGTGGCCDCSVRSEFDVDVVPATVPFFETVSTRVISGQCPQKTLSGATSAILSGSSGRNPPGSGLLAAMGEPSQQYTAISDRARYGNRQSVNLWLGHLGGTLRANGDIQFTSQADDYDGGSEDDPYLLVDTKSDDKIDPNTSGEHVSKIKKGTRVLPWNKDPVTLVRSIPETEAEVRRARPDRSTSSGSATRLTPVSGTQEITVSNCIDCNRPGFCRSGFSASLIGISYPTGTVASGTAIGPCGSDCVITGNLNGPYGGQIDAGGNFNSSGLIVSVSSLAASTMIPMSLNSYEWSVEDFDSCPPTIIEDIGTATKTSSPTPFLVIGSGSAPPVSGFAYLSRPLVYGFQAVNFCEALTSCFVYETASQDCTSECDDYQQFCSASFGVVKFTRDLETGETSATVEYSVTYTERAVFKYEFKLYESYTYESVWVIINQFTLMITDQGTESINYGERYISSGISVIGASYSKRENRIATYRGLGPLCVDGQVQNLVLDFISDELVSVVSNPAIPSPPGGTEVSPGVFEILSESTRPICSIIDPANSVPPPYDRPEFSGAVSSSSCGFYIHPSVGYSPGASASSLFRVHSRVVVTVSGETASSANPGTLTVPPLIGLSSSSIQVNYSDPTFGLKRSVGYNLEYMIDDDIYQEDDWARWVFTEGQYRKVIFPSASMYEVWLLNSFGQLERMVARYRLEGFPYSHWDRDGDNQMRLVSADWSIGKWPIYITVSPVE